jgi:hypothetical protein
MDMKGETFADDEGYRTFAHQLVERIGALPGVRSAALAGPALPTSGSYGLTLVAEGATDRRRRTQRRTESARARPGLSMPHPCRVRTALGTAGLRLSRTWDLRLPK